MDKTIDLLINALNYYDINEEKYKNIISKCKNYSIKRSNTEIDHDMIIFYDDDLHIVFQSRYEILGTFYNNVNLWIHSWANPILNKNLNYISKDILNYGLNMNLKDETLFIKTELITSRFKITDNIQLDIHVAIASYISKQPFIFKLIYDPNLDVRDISQNIYPVPTNINEMTRINYLYLLDIPKK